MPTYIKYKLYALLIGLLPIASLYAQSNKPVAGASIPAPVNTLVSYPGYNVGMPVNYVRTWEALGPQADANAFMNSSYLQARQTTGYVDGLGRPLQTVVKQATPGSSPLDIVSPVVYDEFGREAIKYMPHVSAENNGSFKNNPYTAYESGGAMQTQYPGESFFYSKTDIESSPLNRPVKTFAPGNSWAGSNRGTEMIYLINTQVADDVKIWAITGNSNYELNIPTTSSSYPSGELYKNVVKDEHGNAVVEYKDKEGKVVLKKVQSGDIAADFSGYVNWLCTYYVYDDLNQLRFVIPPKAVAGINTQTANWNISAEIANELCFRYEYDERMRMKAKKVPGAGWVYMVYDKRDRLVYSQDANMRTKNHWLATLYDHLNRPVLTGMLTYTGTLADLNAIVSAAGNGSSTVSVARSYTSNSLAALLEINTLQPGTHLYQSSNRIDWTHGFDTDNSTDLLCEIVPSSPPTNVNENVAVTNNPLPANANFIPLTLTYYDNYAFNTNPGKAYTSANNANIESDNGGNLYPDALPTDAGQAQMALKVKGMVTGTRVRTLPDPNNLAAGDWLTSVSFYDDKGRMVQAHTDNATGGTDVVTNRYNFTNQVITNYLVHHNPQNTDAALQTIRIKTMMQYDFGGRLLQVDKTINDETTKHRIAKMEYDEFGQLTKKWLGQDPQNAAAPLEELLYEYNVRGWLKSINKGYANNSVNSNASTSGPWFGMELSYDWGFDTKQYNGNIAGTKWRSRGDGEQRAYGFGYDKLNRLMFGDFSQGSSYIDDPVVKFDMKMGDGTDPTSAYDENGNIMRMQQWGLTLGSSTQVDDLKYKYEFAGSLFTNKLKNVVDDFNDPGTKMGDFRSSDFYLTTLGAPKTDQATDYMYDNNGNLQKDLNKDIKTIVYNHLNLPSIITVDNGTIGPGGSLVDKGVITYLYDAAGNKLKKTVAENLGDVSLPLKTSTYIGGMVYEDNVLQFLPQEEGRIRYKPASGSAPGSWLYDYFVKDHLGNIRMVLTEEQKTAAYPPASMETAHIATEEALYANLNTTRTDKPTGYPTDTYTSPNDKVAKTNGNGNKIGPSITLKVMAGDKFNVQISSWYKTSAGQTPDPATGLVPSLLSALNNGVGNVPGAKAGVSELTTGNVLLPAVNSFISNQQGITDPGRPKAFLNWVFLDEQFRFVAEGSSAEQVPLESVYGTAPNNIVYRHIHNGLTAKKTGYLYIYSSNETPNIDVFFDNLQVTHVSSPLIEETHYYPFGLVMSGISSKAAGSQVNRYKYNGKELQSKEFTDGAGLETYDYHARMQDPQLGRFWQIDPKCEIFPHYNPYNYCFNNPLLFVDPDGMLAKYNWDDGKYYDEGKEVSFDQVQQQYQIGQYSPTTSVMLAPEFESDGKTVKNDYGTGALGIVVNAAMKTGGNIRVLHVKNADDAATQIEGIYQKITNLFILSHGDAKDAPNHRAYFAIGSQNFHTEDIAKSSALSRIAARLASTPGPLPSAAQVVVFSCGAGGVHNGGVEMLKALAKKLHSTTFGSQSCSAASSTLFSGGSPSFTTSNWPKDHSTAPGYYSNAYNNTGKWTIAYEYGATQESRTITNVYFDAFGRIHYSQ